MAGTPPIAVSASAIIAIVDRMDCLKGGVVTAQAASSPDRHDKQGGGDLYLATSGDLQLAINRDFHLATDTPQNLLTFQPEQAAHASTGADTHIARRYPRHPYRGRSRMLRALRVWRREIK